MVVHVQEFSVIIDDEDLPLFLSRKWWPNRSKYKQTGLIYFLGYEYDDDGKRHVIGLHRAIMRCTRDDKIDVDHIDHDTLNNSKYNLRRISHANNMKNYSKPTTNTSGYKGVSFHSATGKYQASIQSNEGQRYLGVYSSAEKAARVYDIASLYLFKEFALTNFPAEEYSGLNIQEEFFKCIKTKHKFRGVYQYGTMRNVWVASIKYKKDIISLGSFGSEEEAAIAYDAKAFELLGLGKAKLNFPERVVDGVYNKEIKCN